MTTKGVKIIESGIDGPTVTIMAGVHGNEVCGLEGINQLEKLLPSLIKRGRIYLVRANLKAIDVKSRQIDMNLNRAFRSDNLLTEVEKLSYERVRALELMPILDVSEALLDVHSSMSKMSRVFAICEPRSYGIAKLLPVEIISHGWDVIEPGGTDYYMSISGKVGICVECGYHLDPLASKRATSSIFTFLSRFGIIELQNQDTQEVKRFVHAYHIHHTETNFTPFREFADFEALAYGELIGHDGTKPIKAPKNSCIIFCRQCDEPGKEAFILGREEE